MARTKKVAHAQHCLYHLSRRFYRSQQSLQFGTRPFWAEAGALKNDKGKKLKLTKNIVSKVNVNLNLTLILSFDLEDKDHDHKLHSPLYLSSGNWNQYFCWGETPFSLSSRD